MAVFDMLEAAHAVARYTAGQTIEAFRANEMLRDAVERRIEIIGEAARRLSQPFRDQHPRVPWRVIMATRHILVHEYDEVDTDVVWRIATFHVPALVKQLEGLLPSPSTDDA